MSIGIRNIFRLAANFPVTSSVALVDVTGLTVPLGVSVKMKYRIYIPCAVAGATPGVKFQVVVPAAGVSFTQSTMIFNGSTSAVDKISTITASAAVTGALANIANHYAVIEGEVVNGLTAGVLKLQFAQSVSDPAASTVLLGATLETTIE